MILRGGSSTASPVISGLPQGTVQSPLLFRILMSDIDIGVLNDKVVSFADDTRLYLNITYVEDCDSLYYSLISVVYHIMTGKTLTWGLTYKNLSIYLFLQMYILLVIMLMLILAQMYMLLIMLII